jgi:lipoprotein-anchoring transpeptidase ErfK/SrfK
MPRHKRPHPVYSFRFWFLVLAAVCATAAWKLELLPIGKPAAAPAPPTDTVDLGTGSDSGTAAGDDSDIFLSQSEPESNSDGETGRQSIAAEPRVMPRSDSIAQSPFGSASPEFVPAPSFAQAPTAPTSTGSSRIAPVSVASAGSDPDSTGVVLAAGDEFSNAAESAGPPSAPEPAANSFGDPAGAAPPPADFDFSEIDASLAAGTKDADVAAHRKLSELYWQRPELRTQLYSRIEQSARRIYFQPQPHYFSEYVVEKGETLQGIAKKYNVSWEYLEQLNRIQAPRMRAGQSLKVIKGPFAAVVDLSDYEITIHCHGHYVYRFPVGIGMDGSTPIGSFTVEDKVTDPRYDGPDGSIAADDPANPIGERWISIGNGYGIHGTIDPDSIGKSESRGCIRMHNEDVAVVFDLLTVGSEVVIQR